jgi:hypothetical protein
MSIPLIDLLDAAVESLTEVEAALSRAEAEGHAPGEVISRLKAARHRLTAAIAKLRDQQAL